jgi:hypothetical protein
MTWEEEITPLLNSILDKIQDRQKLSRHDKSFLEWYPRRRLVKNVPDILL